MLEVLDRMEVDFPVNISSESENSREELRRA